MNPLALAYMQLSAAIVLEIIGTVFLVESEQFSRLIPTALMGVTFILSCYFLSQSLVVIPLGIAYALWAGLGILLTSISGFLLFQQRLDPAAIIGTGFIAIGVCTIHLFSKSTTQ
jgi:small multidrug resistance pump